MSEKTTEGKTIMKIAISSQGTSLEAKVEAQFGRCPYFIIVDPATEAFEVLINEASKSTGGAGVEAAQLVAQAGVDAVITGNLGPNATRVLQESGIAVYLGFSGTIRQALQQFQERRGQGTSAAEPSLKSAAAAGPTGMVPGLGRGGGGGRGRARGGRFGRGSGLGPVEECLCPTCGARVAHTPGQPCFQTICPQCGSPMRGA